MKTTKLKEALNSEQRDEDQKMGEERELEESARGKVLNNAVVDSPKKMRVRRGMMNLMNRDYTSFGRTPKMNFDLEVVHEKNQSSTAREASFSSERWQKCRKKIDILNKHKMTLNM